MFATRKEEYFEMKLKLHFQVLLKLAKFGSDHYKGNGQIDGRTSNNGLIMRQKHGKHNVWLKKGAYREGGEKGGGSRQLLLLRKSDI